MFLPKNTYRILGGFLLAAFLLLAAGCLPAPEPPISSPFSLTPTVNTIRTPSTATSTSSSEAVSPGAASATPAQATATPAPASTRSLPNPESEEPLTPRPTLGPEEWKTLPVIPTISDRMLAVYAYGLRLGNNPQAFSKIGDCGSTPAWFLGDFDRGESFYRLGEYQYLQDVIAYYHGSFDRTSMAARSGFNASSLLVTLWTDVSQCKVTETPLECELRLHHPTVAFVMLGSNDVWHPEAFEPQMRRIINILLDNGVIPILSTKADNQEGDGSINRTIARLAYEYDVPLLNFWRAVQELPDHGLQEDGVHLTWGRNFFDDPEAMSKAWPVRNLTALQALHALWRKLTGASPASLPTP